MSHSGTQDLLIEIGTEELPASAQAPLVAALAEAVNRNLAGLSLAPAKMQSFATPRRLAVIATEVPDHEPDREIERRGPSLHAAYDAHGKPTRAALGFARAVGTPIEGLEKLAGPDGEWLVHRHTETGRSIGDVLFATLPESLNSLPLPQRMRWGAGTASFLRPVRWIVVRYGAQTIPVEAFGLVAEGESRGHRVHHPGSVILATPADYVQALNAAYVLADPARREAEIRRRVASMARELGGEPAAPGNLYAEITGMTEWPIALSGRFDAKYLALPETVLVTTLAHHQRLVPVRGADGSLHAEFVAIVDLESRDPSVVRHGLERVVRARLEDAAFYYRRDRGRALSDYAGELAGLAFGPGLETMAEKSHRVSRLAATVADAVGADSEVAARAGLLAKCDLLTGLVFEFPELQGVMGGHYAAASGERDTVAAAIAEQYLPSGPEDSLPQTSSGVALGLADRLDTLIGGFAAGLHPTGTKDPFALRRIAFGLLRIATERAPELDLEPLLETAAALYPKSLDAVRVLPAVRDFLRERLRSMLLEQGYATDLAQAVLAVAPLAPAELFARAAALGRFRQRPEVGALAAANKRIANILRQAGPATELHETVSGRATLAWNRLQDRLDRDLPPGEFVLKEALVQAEPELAATLARRDFDTALAILARLRGPVDQFFDEVLVMDPDADIRARRLQLLTVLREAFLKVADIGQLQSAGGA